ncbi:MAG: polymerase factor sigma-70 [Polyangiaceae bacterium]|jgi:RNA polymerase sigma-70 factor (ECF subfamily)|nr:polymerase factor sigma-70 [Polyangiaceae bacterium]
MLSSAGTVTNDVKPLDGPLLAAELQRLRRELLAYCYRLVGSAQEAEDMVQETHLRAWRALSGFQGRASIRSWLYAIATNVCLTSIEQRRTKVLPSGRAAPSRPGAPPPSHAEKGTVSWLEPLPDTWLEPAASEPDAAIFARESLRLALIASLQYLPARQRAIFILREALSFSALETAEILDTTVAAVKSGLQRARAQLDRTALESEALLEPTDARAQELLDGYIAAFERADVQLLVDVLRADATLEATPFGDWRSGRVNCIDLLGAHVLGKPGDWRMLPTTANGQSAVVVYQRDAAGTLQASGVVVFDVTATGISRVVAFHHEPSLVSGFGFPRSLAD